MMSTRRQFLTRATACGTAAAIGLLGHRSAWAAEPSEWVMDAPLLTLKDAGAASGILVGCAVDAKQLVQSYDYAALVRAQTNMVVAENAFKFGPMRPTPHGFNFFQADQVADFAHSNNMRLRGHNFVWHRQLPAWFESYATAGNANEILQTHIATVGARYAGQVHSWDVVNEAIELKDGRADGLRNSPWLQLLGPGYIDAAFVAARKADPKAHLFYNEYGIEGEDDDSAKKREVVLALLAGMQRRGVPVDGLGIQSHLVAGQTYGPGVRSLVRAAHQMGLRVQLTELDVDDRNLAATPAYRDDVVARTYAQYLRAALADGYVSAVLTWGITDKLTWLDQESKRSDGMTQRPLPFDAQLNPKPAFVAQRRALAQAPIVVPVLHRREQLLRSMESASL